MSFAPLGLLRTFQRKRFVLGSRALTFLTLTSTFRGAHSDAHTMSRHGFEVQKSDDDWRKQLTPQEYNVIRKKGTEPARTGEYDKFDPKDGYFACRACANPLYSAKAKFHSGCGWPAFDKCYKDSVLTEVDMSFGMRRVEIVCAKCGGHLGHVFEGERFTDTNQRHCVNSVSIKYVSGTEPAGLDAVSLKL
eukprot:TRINITY_DN2508_c0_g2_i1.p3 TRINITY_DN2508_c0_g2~~TRINITY_DN2508_c0_g2_i1.p3  ORF type:complete len:191 (-),score=64.77 TRINITY_DN2508_c0_g2_i1:106-678(-)